MTASSDREIDWEIARLSGGLSAARRAAPAHQGSIRPSDWDLADREEGPLSKRGEALARDLATIEARKRPIIESIAPMAMESALVAQDELTVPYDTTAKKSRKRGENAFWTGAAAGMSVLALGLVVELGLMSAPHTAAPAPTPAAAAPTKVEAVEEGVAVAPRSMVMLDPVYISADPKGAAPVDAAPIVAAPTGVRARAAVAPSPEAIAPRMVIPPLAAAPPVAGTDISRPAAAVAISVAGRRAASCLADDDLRGTMPVSVTFAPSGRVTTATVDGGPFVGTAVGGCIARALRSASVGPFDGAPVTVRSSVRVR